ncbi:MAG TPA: hypothetical protein VK459_14070, partial [Polyangiaceae bacterium]|nr:hypothetical protein [Polyangiaceae bacterium]
MRSFWLLFTLPFAVGGGLAASCSAAPDPAQTSSGETSGNPPTDSGTGCGECFGDTFTPCKSDGTPGQTITCVGACTPGFGCSACTPGGKVCVG